MIMDRILYIGIAAHLLVAAALAAPPDDVKGWRAARWRMTEAQVSEAFKGEAIRCPESTTSQGLTSSTCIPRFRLAGEEFEVRFWFHDDGLEEISLNRGAIEESAARLYMDIEQMLTAKYGPAAAASKDPTSRLGGFLWHARWNFRSTTFVLNWLGGRGRSGTMTIRYMMISKDADKL